MQLIQYRRIVVARWLGLCFIFTACASATLSPAPEARTMPGAASVVMAEVAGVRIAAQADAWQGSQSVLGQVQPIRITIDNHSSEHIRVRYGDFVLVTASGRRYPALPPFRIEGELMSPFLAVGFTPIASPRFSHRRFYVAPYFGSMYPGIPVYPRSYLLYDPGYYAFWYSDFARSVRPTIEVLSLAVPEGVIEPDGQLSGFLYFRPVDPDARSLTFRATVVAVHDGASTTGGRVLGEAVLPFTVLKSR